jgi:hypothetical protein
MFAITTFLLASLGSAVAQAPPPQAPPPEAPAPQMAQPLESGVCLDSARAVPQVLKPPVSRSMQIVRIDQVVSIATMTPGEVIGFLYTTQDGTAWLGERTAPYMSSAHATEINRVLAATHVGNTGKHGEFPPQSLYGVPTKSPELFQVRVPADAYAALRIEMVPCVIWPSSRPLPDPSLTF